MKLKNIIKVGSFVVAGILPTVSNAQTYMCQACPAGTYSGGGTATSCTPCSTGTYSNGGASSCTQCNPGTYSGSRASQCSPCPSGKYNNSRGSGSCQNCGAGAEVPETLLVLLAVPEVILPPVHPSVHHVRQEPFQKHPVHQVVLLALPEHIPEVIMQLPVLHVPEIHTKI